MKLSAALALLALFLVSPLHAQTPEAQSSDEISVNYVMVPFTALGTNGVPITDLRQRDIKLLVDGKAVATDLFERSTNAPVSLVFLVDASGSMALAGKMEAAGTAVQTVVANAKAGDEFALFMFDNVDVHDVVPFTAKGSDVVSGLGKIKPYGKTAFFDAIAKMPAKIEVAKNPTRAIILISDGIDNASRLTGLQLAAKLEGFAVPIYAIAPRDPKLPRIRGKTVESGADLDTLENVAGATGGKLFLGNKSAHFVSAVSQMDRALRAQYLIGFAPTGTGAIKYRRISLETAARVRAVRVRAGYRGTEPPVLKATR